MSHVLKLAVGFGAFLAVVLLVEPHVLGAALAAVLLVLYALLWEHRRADDLRAERDRVARQLG
jgi:hypothetical protein